MKWLGRIALALTTLILLAPPAHATKSLEVLVVRRGWHIDIGFPVDELSTELQSTLVGYPNARYAFYGFGDRRYLTSKNHGVPTLAAAVWPGAGVILLTVIENDPRAAFGEHSVISLPLSEARMGALQDFLWHSMLSRAGQPMRLRQGPYPGSEYFESTQRYSGLHTCNTWVAQALRAGGFPVRRHAILLAGQLWPKVRRLVAASPSLARPADTIN